MKNNKLYNVWRQIIYRCSENYFQKHLYFDKNISVCENWLNFDNFLKWAKENNYKEGLQIDRKKNNLGYSPENCRFVTSKENVNNRSNTFKIIYNGVEYAFMDLIEIKKLYLNFATIRQRLKNGWTVENAFDKPIKKGKYKRVNFNEKEMKIKINGNT